MMGRLGRGALITTCIGCAPANVACSSDESIAASTADSGSDAVADGTLSDTMAESAHSDAATETQGGPAHTAGACGATRWNARYGGSDASSADAREEGNAVAVDSAGNVFVTGTYVGDADFGGGGRSTGVKNPSLFLVKLDPTGAHLWSKGFGDPGSGLFYVPAVQGYTVATDSKSNVVVAGSMAGIVDFGGGALKSAGPPLPDGGLEQLEEAGLGDSGLFGGCVTGLLDCSPDAVAAKYDAAGNHLWSRTFGAEGGDSVRAAAFDAQGNLFLAGSYEVTIDLGGQALASAGKNDAWVAKLDPDGHHLWSVRFGGADQDASEGIAIDSAGNPIVSGVYSGTATFGGDSLVSAGTFDAFVVKLDAATGNVLWARKAGSTAHAAAQGVSVDGQDAIVVAGHYSGSIDWGGTVTPGIFADDGFVAKLDSAGKALWVKGFGGDGNDRVAAVAVNPAGRVVVVGQTQSPRGIDFGGGRIGGGIDPGAFVLQLDAASGHLCSRIYAGPAGANGVANDSQGNVIVTGGFGDKLDFGLGALSATSGEDIFVGSFGP